MGQVFKFFILSLYISYTVTNSGAANPVSVVAIDGAKKTVILMLPNEVKANEVVTLSYKDPTAGNDVNAIQDVAGNDAVSITLTGTQLIFL